MTHQGLFENYWRICHFLNYSQKELCPELKLPEIKPRDIINAYARVLDMHGCPHIGLSRLYFHEAEDFVELREWVLGEKMCVLYDKAREFGFESDTLVWYVTLI